MSRDLSEYQQEYAVNPFEDTMAKLRWRILLEFLGRHRVGHILEVGCVCVWPLFELWTIFSLSASSSFAWLFWNLPRLLRAHKEAAGEFSSTSGIRGLQRKWAGGLHYY